MGLKMMVGCLLEDRWLQRGTGAAQQYTMTRLLEEDLSPCCCLILALGKRSQSEQTVLCLRASRTLVSLAVKDSIKKSPEC